MGTLFTARQGYFTNFERANQIGEVKVEVIWGHVAFSYVIHRG